MSGLPRRLNVFDAYMLIVGNIIGIGIFTTTGYIADKIQLPGSMLLIWLVGGILSFCGGVTYAELSSRFPKAGGDFHFLSSAYHSVLGFLFGWSALLVTYTGSIAVIAVGFSHYFANFFPESYRNFQWSVPLAGLKLDLIKMISIGVIYIFTYLNIRGVQAGSFGQNILTFGSMSVLVLFIIVGFISPKGDWQNFVPFVSMDISLGHLSKFGVALVGVYFTYSGWTILAYVAGEIKRPSRSIPYATGWGVITVLLLYLLINVVYVLAFPPSQMKNIVDIGHVVFTTLWSEQLSAVFIIMIMIAVLSTLNATILSGARIYYAMSINKRLFRWFGEIHPKYQSPANALKFQFFWTILLILSGSFNQLLTYTVFIMVVFGFLSGLSIFILRKKKENRQGIYLAWGYPFTPMIYIIITGWIMLNTLKDQTLESAIGLILVAVGLPFYYYFSKKHRKN